MALTLTEAAKLSNDVMLAGVIETIVKESPVLQRLPFIELVGNALTYNRENAAAGANWFADVRAAVVTQDPTPVEQTVAACASALVHTYELASARLLQTSLRTTFAAGRQRNK